MVPGVGIEPTLLAERDFESRASTNSAIPASLYYCLSLTFEQMLVLAYYFGLLP